MSNTNPTTIIQHRANRILAALPPEDFQRIAPHLIETPLTFKRMLYKPDQRITQVSNFPTPASAP